MMRVLLCALFFTLLAAPAIAASAPDCAKIIDLGNATLHTPSAMKYAITGAAGKKPAPTQVAIVRYVLCLPSGKLVDASPPGVSFAFTVGAKQVIRGFDEAVQQLGLGQTLRVHIPSAKGYGPKGSPPVIPPNTDLIFQIKLIGIQRIALSTLLKNAYEAHGTAAMVAAYDRAAATGFQGMYAKEDDLNSFGYRLLKKKHFDAAIAALSLNADRFPRSWNSYDSLGDAYRRAGQKDYAAQNYKRALQLNPKDTNAIAQLKKLQAPKP